MGKLLLKLRLFFSHLRSLKNCKLWFLKETLTQFCSFQEFRYWKSFSLWCCQQNLHCNRQLPGGYAVLWTLLWHDRCCHWCVLYIWVSAYTLCKVSHWKTYLVLTSGLYRMKWESFLTFEITCVYCVCEHKCVGVLVIPLVWAEDSFWQPILLCGSGPLLRSGLVTSALTYWAMLPAWSGMV